MHRWWWLLWAFTIVVAPCFPQQQNPAIQDVAARAGIIFRGTVLAVTREAARAPGELAATRVSFRVDDGIRGAISGQTMTIRQWNVGPEEYRVGEVLLLFLHKPSELGFTSPVGGNAGHRRMEEVPADLLNSLHTERSATAETSANPPQRPTRPSRSVR